MLCEMIVIYNIASPCMLGSILKNGVFMNRNVEMEGNCINMYDRGICIYCSLS